MKFNFEFFINTGGGEVQLITSLLHLFCEIPGVLGLARKLLVVAFRTMFHFVNAGSIGCAIQFRVFDQ